MPSKPPSFFWPILAVVMPLVVLAVLAYAGVRAQTRAAWAGAREEAKALAALRAEALARDLSAHAQSAALFPCPPVPTPARPNDTVLEGTDVEALRRLRDDPAAGSSNSGLPLRALAALRLHQIDPKAQRIDDLVTILVREAPSILTPVALEMLAASDPGAVGPALDEWKHAESARADWRRNPQAGWRDDGDGLRWIAAEGGTLQFLDSEAVREALEAQSRRLPAWAGISLATEKLHTGSPAGSEVMASVPVAFGEGMRLEIVAAAPAMIESAVRRQAAWTFALLASAVLVSTGALLMILRMIKRERKLGELKSQFVSSVSHELRAPVGSIRLMAEALREGKVRGPAADEFHGLIAREGARLSHLVENVLDFARIEEGRKRYRFEEADLAPLVRDTVRLMEPAAAERGVHLVVEAPELAAAVDAAAIQQALVNLLDNAIKFSPPDSTATVTLVAGPGRWTLAVRDDGPGIAPADHERIFERFHRLGNELRRETQGTGIGLSIVKHIAEAHGGRVRLDSAPGCGSTFTLDLPEKPPEAA